jgi:Xaa-Pro aminopeptidase
MPMKTPPQRRRERLQQILIERQLDGILISQAENRRYLSGFTGSAGWLIITRRQALIVTDFRYLEQVSHQCPDLELVRQDEAPHVVIAETAKKLGIRSLGVEGRAMTLAFYQDLQAALGDGQVTLVTTVDVVEDLRAVKDAEELAIIRRAVELTDRAFALVAPRLQVGMTERAAAWEIEKTMRELGADATAFDLIVASGPNGALPHARATDRVIGMGEPIVIDMGARVDGYHSDMTRTVVVGDPDDRFPLVYGVVLEAQVAAEKAIRAGLSGKEVDAIARGIIASAGYGEAFGHSLGHGVGLAVHEAPLMGPRSPDSAILADGMIVTVEPGIYLPGWGGVRIEDMVVVRDRGAEVLTQSPKGGMVNPIAPQAAR